MYVGIDIWVHVYGYLSGGTCMWVSMWVSACGICMLVLVLVYRYLYVGVSMWVSVFGHLCADTSLGVLVCGYLCVGTCL